MSQKEHLAEWTDDEGKMVIKILREGHTLQRCLVADTRGKSFPVLLELSADRSQKGWRPRPQEPSTGFGTCGACEGGTGRLETRVGSSGNPCNDVRPIL